MPEVQDATPMLALHDIDAGCRFLEECLGFATSVRMEGYAYLRRDGGAIRLIGADPAADLEDPARQVTVYIDVDDVDAMYQERKTALDSLPEGHFRAPFDQDYGQREMHVIHGPILFFVGQPAKGRP